jgi:hypothetical protein
MVEDAVMGLKTVKSGIGIFRALSGDLITKQLEEYGAHSRPELTMLMAFVRPGGARGMLVIGGLTVRSSLYVSRNTGASAVIASARSSMPRVECDALAAKDLTASVAVNRSSCPTAVTTPPGSRLALFCAGRHDKPFTGHYLSFGKGRWLRGPASDVVSARGRARTRADHALLAARHGLTLPPCCPRS